MVVRGGLAALITDSHGASSGQWEEFNSFRAVSDLGLRRYLSDTAARGSERAFVQASANISVWASE